MKRVLKLMPWILAPLLAACSTPYKFSPEVESMRKSMTQAEAVVVVQKILAKPEKTRGICNQRDLRLETRDPAAITEDGIDLRAIRPGKLVRISSSGNLYEKEPYIEHIAFESIDVVAVTFRPDAGKNYYYCVGDYQVSLSGIGISLDIVVPKQHIDTFLSALSVLAPRARFVEDQPG